MLRAIYRAFRHEFGLKLVSILMATGLWLYVINTEDPIRREVHERAIVPIEVPADLEVTKIRPEKVALHLRGRLSALQRTGLASLQVVAPLTSQTEGRNQVGLELRGVPERVTVEGLERITAQVWLDRRAAGRADVVPVLVGKLADGYELAGAPSIRPSQVRVIGAAGIVERIRQVTVRVDISGLDVYRAFVLAPVARDANKTPIPGIAFDPPHVTVEVRVTRLITGRVPVRAQVGPPASGYGVSDVRVDPDAVALRGRPEPMRAVTAVKTELVNIENLRGTKSYRVPMIMPDGVSSSDGRHTVTVRVTVRPARAPEPPVAGESVEPGETPERAAGEDETTPPPERAEPGTKEPATHPTREPDTTAPSPPRAPDSDGRRHEPPAPPAGPAGTRK